MDDATRLHYLEAMGIDVWRSRLPAAPQETSTAEAVSASDDSAAMTPEQRTEHSSSEKEAWRRLESEVSQCRKCGLCESRSQTVFGSGCRQTDWMLIGEAPGQQEDLQGLPFVGKAGMLLTEMLRAMGLARDEVFITNILKCRPPGNRDPKPEEAASCREYLDRQIALVRPKIILAVGRISAQTLLETDAPLSRLRGKVHLLNDIPVIVVYHPAYLLRNPADKKKAWLDLLFAMQTYRNIKG
ncbi:MAG: uracil-DNA glycosylase [Gammaproteobacteria bacterium]